LEIIEKFDLTPIVLKRNIYDAAVSLAEHLANEAPVMAMAILTEKSRRHSGPLWASTIRASPGRLWADVFGPKSRQADRRCRLSKRDSIAWTMSNKCCNQLPLRR
jgi:hypothetical protein